MHLHPIAKPGTSNIGIKVMPERTAAKRVQNSAVVRNGKCVARAVERVDAVNDAAAALAPRPGQKHRAAAQEHADFHNYWVMAESEARARHRFGVLAARPAGDR